MTPQVTLSPPFEERDVLAARRVVAIYNAKQPLDENENPTNQLPTETNAELKSSYETALAEHITIVHEHERKLAASEAFAQQAQDLWKDATEAQRAAAVAALQG